MKTPWNWLIPLLVAIDQLIAVLLRKPLGWLFRTDRFGDPDETISSVLGKEARAGNPRAMRACRMLDWIDRGHCEKAIERDEGNA